MHADKGLGYVGAPVFARADGVAARAASFVVGGREEEVERAVKVGGWVCVGVRGHKCYTCDNVYTNITLVIMYTQTLHMCQCIHTRYTGARGHCS